MSAPTLVRTGIILPVDADPAEHIGRLVQLLADEEIEDTEVLTALHAAGLTADRAALDEAVEALKERDDYLAGWKDADCPTGCSQRAANELAAAGWDAELTDAVRRLATPAREAVA